MEVERDLLVDSTKAKTSSGPFSESLARPHSPEPDLESGIPGRAQRDPQNPTGRSITRRSGPADLAGDYLDESSPVGDTSPGANYGELVHRPVVESVRSRRRHHRLGAGSLQRGQLWEHVCGGIACANTWWFVEDSINA